MTATRQDAMLGGGLVRVTIASGERRRDLVVPSGIPVAEMLPDLARSVGALDPTNAHLGLRLLTPDGHELAAAATLLSQGVRDGMVLMVAAADTSSPKVYDDVVEAMADVIEESTTPWRPEAARRTALSCAVSLLAVGAVAVALGRVSILGGVLAGILASALLVAAIVVARVEDEHEIALVLAWCAVAYGGVGAFTAVGHGPVLGLPACATGVAVAAGGLLAMVGLRRGRLNLLPAVVVGGVVAAASGIVAGTELGAAEVYVVAMTVTILAAGLQPVLALAAAGGSAPQPEDPNVMPEDPDVIDLDGVRGGAGLGHGVLVSVTVSTGLMITLVAPLAVGLGVTGAIAAVCGGGVLLLRTRLFRSGDAVAAGFLAGAVALASVAVSAIVLQPSWRPGLIVVVVLAAAGTLLASLLPTTASVSRGRLAEVVEVVAMVALIPLTVVAVGLVSAVTS